MSSDQWIITRRDFLKASGIVTLGLSFAQNVMKAWEQDSPLLCRFGMVTDPHYADIEDHGTRYYRQSIQKMSECVELMNQEKVDFLIELGDFTNGTPDGSLNHLKEIEEVFRKFNGPRYHVLGNHDLDSLSKEQFQSIIENTHIGRDQTYYSFTMKGVQFIVLDATFTSEGLPYKLGNFHWTDANISADQLAWLNHTLEQTDLPVVLFVHQLLDSREGIDDRHSINNATQVRAVLESHPRVMAVFQGHQHQGQYHVINDIHYYTLKAMVEGSGEESSSYAIAEIFKNGSIRITGYRKAVGVEINRA